MFVIICYFIKSVKSVFILVQCSTSLSKNYVAHLITVVCVIGWISGEKKVCLRSLALCAYEISHRTWSFHEFAFNNKVLKTFVEFRICWKRSKFGHCRIWTLSHLHREPVIFYTNWSCFEGHGFMGRGHRNVFWRRRTDLWFAGSMVCCWLLSRLSLFSSHLIFPDVESTAYAPRMNLVYISLADTTFRTVICKLTWPRSVVKHSICYDKIRLSVPQSVCRASEPCLNRSRYRNISRLSTEQCL